ncbi:MAG: FAD:protein FMN transferase [Planctomycetales bacterium]|nr:FAD:protein FMN transferase [Planctomycetales bacterium]
MNIDVSRHRVAVACLALLVISNEFNAPSAARADEPLLRFQQSQPHMGTRFVFTLYAANAQQAGKALSAVARRIEAIEQRMSDYRPDSEIRRLGHRAAAWPPAETPQEPLPTQPISDELRTVLTESRRVGERSCGAFDISIAPLSELWRISRRTGAMPDPAAHRRARECVGPSHWSLTPGGVVMNPGVRFDLGGIAKGYALDESIRVLREHGIQSALVDGGGDLAASDPPPGRDAWRIGVAPLQADGRPEWVLALARAAVATSGDAWQFVTIDGRRYSHVIDPQTGWGVEGRHSATVYAPTGIAADAWASALCVLGPQRGIKLLQTEPGAEAIVTTLVDGAPQQSQSAGFSRVAQRREPR